MTVITTYKTTIPLTITISSMIVTELVTLTVIAPPIWPITLAHATFAPPPGPPLTRIL